MKIEVGKKYRMRNYPTPYLYVQIISRVKDIQPSCYESEEKAFYGVIVEESNLIYCKYLLSEPFKFGEKGSWDNAEAHGDFYNNNDLIVEITPPGESNEKR